MTTINSTTNDQPEERSIAGLFESDVSNARPHWTKEAIHDFMDTYHDTILDEVMANLNDWLDDYQASVC